MNRRKFIGLGITAAASFPAAQYFGSRSRDPSSFSVSERVPPSFVTEVVVGDGKWVWKKPPADAKGFLEPREYELAIGVEMQGRGSARSIQASTPVPCALPEQRIDDVRLTTQGCVATIRKLAPEANQLYLEAPAIFNGQTIRAIAHYRLTLYKQYHGFTRDYFPAVQKVPRDIARIGLGASPGINTRSTEVANFVRSVLTSSNAHPWDKALAFFKWTRENMAFQHQNYTSVARAIRNKTGDCEEHATVFIAACRAVGIPARLVLVPSHVWAEFFLSDHNGKGHWIPVHTAAYPWFGWTGAHEVVLHKGDRIRIPEQHRLMRLVPDWSKWLGKAPEFRYIAELKPLAAKEGIDPGPGARRKTKNGLWVSTSDHPLDHHLRGGRKAPG